MRVLRWCLPALLAAGLFAQPALAQSRISKQGYRELLTEVRAQARTVGLTTSRLERLLEERGTLNAPQALYLFLMVESRFQPSVQRKELAGLLQRRWARDFISKAYRHSPWKETRYLAYMHLRAAAADGVLTSAELQLAEQAMTAAKVQHPKIQLKKVAGFPRFAEAILEGESARTFDPNLLSRILGEHFPGRQVDFVDSNQNQRLDPSDRVRVGEEEQVLGSALARQILIQKAIYQNAVRLLTPKGKIRLNDFRVSAKNVFDSRYFRKSAGAFIRIPSVTPAVALGAIYRDPEEYYMECATAISVVHYSAIRDTYRAITGNDDFFNTQFSDLRVGRLSLGASRLLTSSRTHVGGTSASNSLGAAGRVDQLGGQSNVIAPDPRRTVVLETEVDRRPKTYKVADLKTGDHIYFLNPDVSASERKKGWNGENAIYLGDGLFFSHPFGLTTAGKIVAKLNEKRAGLHPRSAYPYSSGQIRIVASALPWPEWR